jgi:hypothetical protein
VCVCVCVCVCVWGVCVFVCVCVCVGVHSERIPTQHTLRDKVPYCSNYVYICVCVCVCVCENMDTQHSINTPFKSSLMNGTLHAT